jgi:hypothetical protein
MWGAAPGLGGVDESAPGLHHLLAHVGDHQNAIDTTIPLDQALLCSTCEIPTDELKTQTIAEHLMLTACNP